MIAQRYRTVRALLSSMSTLPGWALVKDWDEPTASKGDVDLLVDPIFLAEVEKSIWYFLTRHNRQVLVAFRCTHIPDVPRILALAPTLGFEAELLEIDLATVVPFRGYPLLTFKRLQSFVVRDTDGVPRLAPEAEETVRFLSGLRWLRRAPGPPSLGAQRVLVSISPRHLRPVWSLYTALGRVWPAVLALGMLGTAVLKHPDLALSRGVFRARERLCGLTCPFDPRYGRGSRAADAPAALAERARRSGHAVVIRN